MYMYVYSRVTVNKNYVEALAIIKDCTCIKMGVESLSITCEEEVHADKYKLQAQVVF